jgi:hypothetical protein
MDTSPEQRLDPRSREAHPEQIVVGDETFIRNDKIAERHGVSERTVNRGDRDGAPYRFFGGVKYRPERRYDQFVLDSIQVRRQPQPQAGKRKQRPR